MTLAPVSYFIPSYNCAATVLESFQSILQGNFLEGDEIIMTNDASTDGTAEILNDLQTKYPFVRVFHNAQNKGGAATRNVCISHAKHDLLFCLDSDNLLVPDSMPALRKYQQDTQADVVSFQEMRYFSVSTDIIEYIWKFRESTNLSDFLADYRNPASSGNYMFTKESWKKANGYPEFSGALDTWGFGFYQLATGSKMVALPGSYYLHRYGGESYYIRDMNKRNLSLGTLQVMIPYLHLIHPDDIEYMFSKEHRNNWLEHLLEHPIRTADNVEGQKAQHINIPREPKKMGLLRRILRKLDRMLPAD